MADNPYQQQMMPWNMGFQNPYGMTQNQNMMLLQQLSQGFAPIMTMPQQQMRTGFEQLPGFNNPGLLGFGLNMIVAPMLQQQMLRQGMVAGGLSSQNIMDVMQRQQHQRQQQEMLTRIAGETTQAGVVDFIRGAHEMTGREFGGQQRLAARQLGTMAATFAPVLAQLMPDQLDAMSGRRGSAVVMANRMGETNRYRMDPVTGLMGYDPETTEQEATMLFNEMFADENMANMRGVRAGEVGGMYRELTRRGMIGADTRPSYLRTAEAAESVMAIGGAAEQRVLQELTAGRAGRSDPQDIARTPEGYIDYDELTTQDWDTLRNQTDVSTQMRAFNADKVKSSLQGYVDVVSTMKEIFGEAGRTDAPMSELIASLEALSQGGLTQVSPNKLNQMVRTTTELAQTSGVTLDAAMMMQQQAAGLLESRGMNRLFATQVTQGGLSYGQGMGVTGSFANPAWGLGDMNENRQLDQNLRVNAITSPLTNALSALSRGEAMGGYEGPQGEDTEAAAISRAIEANRSTYQLQDASGKGVGPVMNIANLHPARIRAIIARDAPNISRSEARRLISQTSMNQERSFEKDIGNLVRDDAQTAQVGEQVYARTARYAARLIEDDQGNLLIDKDDQDTAINIGEEVRKAMLGMTPEERTDPDRRQKILADAIMIGGGGIAGLDQAEAEKQAMFMWGQMEEQISGKRANPAWSGYGSLQNMMLQQDPVTKAIAKRQRQLSDISARTKNNMAGFTGGSWLGQMYDAVREAGQEGTNAGAAIDDVLGKAAGGVDVDEIRDRLLPGMEELAETENRVNRLTEQYNNAPPGEVGSKEEDERARIYKEILAEQQALKSQNNALRTLAESSGLLDQAAALDLGDITGQQEAVKIEEENREGFLQGDPAATAREVRFGRMTETEAAKATRAAKRSTTLTNELLETAVLDPKFLETTGGRGIAAIRGIEEAQRTKYRLLSFYGGNAGRQSFRAIDMEGSAEDLSDLVRARMNDPNAFFQANGELLDQYSNLEGLKGLTKKDFLGTSEQTEKNRQILGAASINQDVREADKAIAENVNFIASAVVAGDEQFLLDPSEEVLDQLGFDTDPEAESLTGTKLDKAERLQAFRNIQLGLGKKASGLSMKQLARLASGKKLTEKEIKDAGIDPDSGLVDRISRLGEATVLSGRLGKEGHSAVENIRSAEKAIADINKTQAKNETHREIRADIIKRHQETIDESRETISNLLGGDDFDIEDIITGKQDLGEFRQELGDEAKRITKLDRNSVIGGMVRALGITDEDEIKKLRETHGQFGQTTEGRNLATIIEKSSGVVSSIAKRHKLGSGKVYEAIQAAVEGNQSAQWLTDELDKLSKSDDAFTTQEASALLTHGGRLRTTGMLEGLADLKPDALMDYIGERLEKMKEEGLEAEDVIKKSLDITGTLKIVGDIGTLLSTTGDHRTTA